VRVPDGIGTQVYAGPVSQVPDRVEKSADFMRSRLLEAVLSQMANAKVSGLPGVKNSWPVAVNESAEHQENEKLPVRLF
jgi:hypothetical protein